VTSTILVLGAYGLAGRAIVKEILDTTPHQVLAAGRKADRLATMVVELPTDRVRTIVLDATDVAALTRACGKADFVINASGPYAKFGAQVARAVIDAGRPYLDCANEQVHYERLRAIGALASSKSLPLITAAGAIPGLSSLLIVYMLKMHPEARSVDCAYAQLRHAYEDGGLGSMMSGVLEAVNKPLSLREGAHVSCLLGAATQRMELPKPIGLRQFFELPNIDVLTLPHKRALRNLRVWFYMGDIPTWLFPIIRLLRPDRHPMIYRLLERIVDNMNTKEIAHAIATGQGPEGVIQVTVSSGKETLTGSLTLRDGAVATAFLPAYIANAYLSGMLDRSGVLTPTDLVTLSQIEQPLQRILLTHSLPNHEPRC
jgi:short subunit dehydrogenase-like uncharacterized protein